MVVCTFCPKDISFCTNRMFSYFGYRGAGVAHSNVAICKLMLTTVRKLFKQCNGMVSKCPGDLSKTHNNCKPQGDDGDKQEHIMFGKKFELLYRNTESQFIAMVETMFRIVHC